MISSTMPSAKYSCSGSPLRFWNGRTAIDGLPGSAGTSGAAGTASLSSFSSALPQRLIELDGLRLRLDTELGMQPVTQTLEQLDRLHGLAALGMDLHERAASNFAQRIEREQAMGGAVAARDRQRRRQQPGQRILVQPAQ